MHVAVTGGTGFLGSHLVRRLLARGDRVTVLSRHPDRLGSTRLADCAGNCAVLPLSVAGMTEVAAQRPDAVLHAAACYGRNGESWSDLIAANVQLPLQLLDAGGTAIGLWISIGSALPATVSPYALSKRQHAEWLSAFPDDGAPPRILLPFQQFYGPGDDENKFISLACARLAAGLDLPTTVGTQVRDLLYIDDAAAALICVLDRAARSPGTRIIPVGSGIGVTMREVVETIHAACGQRGRPIFGAVPLRSHEPDQLIADIGALRSMGWSAKVGLADGLRRTVAAVLPARRNESP
jgi:nucleoside-diphosphate-sugar epimerase